MAKLHAVTRVNTDREFTNDQVWVSTKMFFVAEQGLLLTPSVYLIWQGVLFYEIHRRRGHCDPIDASQ
jgi:hypothetical protein